jgi:hypothetical protein
MLRLQGVSWFTRKVISYATISLDIAHYKDDQSIEHIDIDQNLSPGGISTREERILWWREKEHYDNVFGHVLGKSRRVKDVRGSELEETWLKEGWTNDTYEHGVVHSYVESNTPKSGVSWIVNQTWGFEIVEGARRYTRHLKFTGPNSEDMQIRLVYDYSENRFSCCPDLRTDKHLYSRSQGVKMSHVQDL